MRSAGQWPLAEMRCVREGREQHAISAVFGGRCLCSSPPPPRRPEGYIHHGTLKSCVVTLFSSVSHSLLLLFFCVSVLRVRCYTCSCFCAGRRIITLFIVPYADHRPIPRLACNASARFKFCLLATKLERSFFFWLSWRTLFIRRRYDGRRGNASNLESLPYGRRLHTKCLLLLPLGPSMARWAGQAYLGQCVSSANFLSPIRSIRNTSFVLAATRPCRQARVSARFSSHSICVHGTDFA